MNELLGMQIGIILHPVITFKKILQHEKRLLYSLYTILLFGTGYTVAVIFAFISKHHSYGIPLILKIPLDKYYLYESFFLLPVTICTWILLAGLIKLVSIPLKGNGSFEDTLSVLGFPFIILFMFMLIPDAITDYILRNTIASSTYWNVINPIRLFLPTVWIMILHILAIREVQGIKGIKIFVVFIVAYIPYMALVMTYIR